jgi:hypothetical protein
VSTSTCDTTSTCDRYLFVLQQKIQQREIEKDVSARTPLCDNPPPILFPLALSFFFAAFRSFDPKLSQHLFRKFSRANCNECRPPVEKSGGELGARSKVGKRRKEAERMAREREGGRMKGREGASRCLSGGLFNECN